jgi:hypothetical protein
MTRDPIDGPIAQRYARAVGCADALISTGLVFCKYPGRDLLAFVAEMRKLLTEAQADIEALVNGKGEAPEPEPVAERHGLRVVGSLRGIAE